MPVCISPPFSTRFVVRLLHVKPVKKAVQHATVANMVRIRELPARLCRCASLFKAIDAAI
jgi:hypothetical protein